MKLINEDQYKFPIVKFTYNAYNKILDLINATNLEIAWLGVVTEIEPGEYLVIDILVYPQIVDATNVESDDDKYPQWLMDVPNNTFNKLRLQGHSHVDMHVSPSANDKQNVRDFITQIQVNDYYIFMIINKDEDIHMTIVDKRQNVIFQDNEIEIELPEKVNSWADRDIEKYVSRRPVKVRRSLNNDLIDNHGNIWEVNK